ncbi:MAG TPA: 23S rRNA (guanine(745)-N(1))-methyltransferase, partial [Rheinheimera sp.]|nr:23S rRNA (guanine(745)-N(1))-methyltransferase [Rheinheimera sp.]
IYAPSKAQELQRLLTPRGHLLTVSPGPGHLVEIKQAVYDKVQLHSDDIMQISGLTHVKRQRLQFRLQFEHADDVEALIQMVPLAWKFSPGQKQQFAAALPSISVDFLLDLYQKS